MNTYFTVSTTDGTYLDFGKLCNVIEPYNDGSMIAFKHKQPENRCYLAFIPVSKIICIINHGAVDELINEYQMEEKPDKDPYWDEEDDEDDNPFYRME